MSNIITLESCHLVKVPEGAKHYDVVTNRKGVLILAISGTEEMFGNAPFVDSIPLPPGNYGSPVLWNNASEELRQSILSEIPSRSFMERKGDLHLYVIIPKIQPQ